MIYRKFGKNEEKLSVLGFGAMRFAMKKVDGKVVVDEEIAIPLVRKAVELGINYFDTAWFYCEHQSQSVLGKALKLHRDKVYISTKLPVGDVKKPQDFDYFLEESIKRLDCDYIDFYHLHGINEWGFNNIIKDMKMLEYAERAKAKGLIKHLSFSFHDRPEAMKTIADSKVFDSVLCQFNLLDPKNSEAMQYVKEVHKMGVIVMGPLAGGNITSGGEDFVKLFDTDCKTAVELGLKYVIGAPFVDVALSGMSDQKMLIENVNAAIKATSTSKTEWEQMSANAEKLASFRELPCTECAYCHACPKKLKPNVLFKAYNDYKIWHLESRAKDAYYSIGHNPWSGSKLEDCTKCGLCVTKCPQKIAIPEKIQEISEFFKKL